MQIDWTSFAIGGIAGLVLGFILKLSELKNLNLKLEEIGFSLGVEGFRRKRITSRKQIVGDVGRNFTGQAAGGNIGSGSGSRKNRETRLDSSDLQVVGDVGGNFTGQAAGQDIHQTQTIGSLSHNLQRDITHRQFAGRDINHTSNLYQTVQAAAREALKGEGNDILRLNKNIRFNAVIQNSHIRPQLQEVWQSTSFENYVQYCVGLSEFRQALLSKLDELQQQGWRILEVKAVDQINGGLIVESMVEKLFDISS